MSSEHSHVFGLRMRMAGVITEYLATTEQQGSKYLHVIDLGTNVPRLNALCSRVHIFEQILPNEPDALRKCPRIHLHLCLGLYVRFTNTMLTLGLIL